MSWREAISLVADSKKTNDTLVNIGIRMASLQGDGTISDILTQARPALSKIEATLGLISHEAIFNFQSGRKTITSEQSTRQNFDVQELTKILDGEHSVLIRKVKTLLSDPEFGYVSPGDLDLYRKRVLQWCKFLAEQRYGSMAYPKEFGGQNDMAAYFAIMETLSYHDLSMVIKFGVQFGLWGNECLFFGY
ncbi:MAG: hypothetical protein U5K54_07820 [Cytophagales bacterium]|nr:hypothetical protein [Cytophagales bacterium]